MDQGPRENHDAYFDLTAFRCKDGGGLASNGLWIAEDRHQTGQKRVARMQIATAESNDCKNSCSYECEINSAFRVGSNGINNIGVINDGDAADAKPSKAGS